VFNHNQLDGKKFLKLRRNGRENFAKYIEKIDLSKVFTYGDLACAREYMWVCIIKIFD